VGDSDPAAFAHRGLEVTVVEMLDQVRPDTTLAQSAGVEVSARGAIVVVPPMRTGVDRIRRG
jgi:NAD(P)H-nitrite reductase large subunit